MIRELSIYSETAPLQQVMIHHPGDELALVSPFNHDDLLFDDILMQAKAEAEHATMEALFKALGVDVLRTEDLFRAALPQEIGAPLRWDAPLDDLKRFDLERLIWEVLQQQNQASAAREALSWRDRHLDALQDQLRGLYAEDQARFARRLISGILTSNMIGPSFALADTHRLPPIPNLIFMRDPAIVIRDKLIISAMATPARLRESLIMWTIFRRALPDSAFWFDPYSHSQDRHDSRLMKVEGGDVLILHERVLAIGISERTSKDMLQTLAERFLMPFGSNGAGVQVVYAVLLPRERAVMHLDTIFTMTAQDECLLFPPMLLPTGTRQAQVLRLTKNPDNGLKIEAMPDFLSALENDLRHFSGRSDYRLKPIFCGGGRYLDQVREQWTDGANCFALAPGVIVLYDRNEKTFAALAEAGYEICSAAQVLSDPALQSRLREAVASGSYPSQKFALSIPSSELSRARGGPHCMTMPISRAPQEW